MKVLTQLDQIPAVARGGIVAIGNFDGVHKGHQALLAVAKEVARAQVLPLVVLTFEPHPRKLFRPDDPPFRITPFPLKQQKLREFGVDYLVALTFDWAFASRSAEEFVRMILQQGLEAAHIVVGEDFCFGQLRKGTIDTLRAAGLEVTAVAPKGQALSHGEKYASSAVRQALRQGRLEEANQILGWDWEVWGEVVRGDQRGRELGYPTANIALGEALHPAYGVYACLAQIEGEDRWWPSATNIGIRPMFEIKVGQVEAHILEGFDRDIYGKILRVKPVRRLRGEAKFNSLEDLCRQISRDCDDSLRVLAA
ncbi:MAG: bifunctional riboflavin kinase/FAD synthetase [Rhodospirillales bacterium]|nr:bifunctional riboflavin kinase/FAD synthetase [Rhodospirillales bacterium]MCB9965391.1 bifunctional riboflavin kinase/FAD synthetase [Rhodospirillales bacterium]MCB9973286.1 bifunctional riboflavin kinase/FAD synthetase [Rhodospirillales bacterium]MCB9980608.1 bifunctional riboflavin kinase/FAD synthetase [Rhodospirillales bacterium]